MPTPGEPTDREQGILLMLLIEITIEFNSLESSNRRPCSAIAIANQEIRTTDNARIHKHSHHPQFTALQSNHPVHWR
jgi:hypothetical protein